jgi:ADP-heptose:LPS heptosyltransferase
MRAIVVRLDNDGDVLLAGPAVRAVAAGADHVTLLCGPRGAAAAAILPGVDAVLVRRAEWIDPEPGPVRRADIEAYVDAIAAVRADVAVVLTSFHQSALPIALLLRLAGVPRIAAVSEDYPGSLLDVRVPDPGEVHETQRALAVAEALGFSLPHGDDGGLAVLGAEPPDFLPEHYVVVHPGASVPARAWEPERQRELVAALADAGRSVVVTGAPSERALTAYVSGTRAIDLAGTTSLAQLAGVLAGADATIVGNTGPAHLSAAVGTPVVSLFAPTVPAARWRPWGVRHELLLLGDVGVGDVLRALDSVAGGTDAVAA